jgi:hypothetical protein
VLSVSSTLPFSKFPLKTLPFAMALGWAGFAWGEDSAGQSVEAQSAPNPVRMTRDLSGRTDEELTALTARWGDLAPEERRRLLAEVRGRMAQNQARKGRVGVSRATSGVLVQRRYGRKADGSVVVETRVLEIAPREVQATVGPQQTLRDAGKPRGTFGIGFEQRVRRSGPPQTESPLDLSKSAP